MANRHVDVAIFPKLKHIALGSHKQIKESGKGDVQHFRELPKTNLGKIFSMFEILLNLVNLRGTSSFIEALRDLTVFHRDSYNRMLRDGAQFAIQLFDCRRG